MRFFSQQANQPYSSLIHSICSCTHNCVLEFFLCCCMHWSFVWFVLIVTLVFPINVVNFIFFHRLLMLWSLFSSQTLESHVFHEFTCFFNKIVLISNIWRYFMQLLVILSVLYNFMKKNEYFKWNMWFACFFMKIHNIWLFQTFSME